MAEKNDRLWQADLAVHAEYLRDHGQFRDVRYLTRRNDAPLPIKTEARRALCAAVAQGMLAGDVVVVPVLLSSGGIEDEIRADLRGLKFRFAKPLLPHPNVQRWVEAQLRALTSGKRSRIGFSLCSLEHHVGIIRFTGESRTNCSECQAVTAFRRPPFRSSSYRA